MRGSLLRNLSDPAPLSTGECALDVFMACPASLRIFAFAFTWYFRKLRGRARDIWLGKVERRQLDAELSAVRGAYFSMVQPVHQHQAMEITSGKPLDCSGEASARLCDAICSAVRLPNPNRLRKERVVDLGSA